MPLTAYGSLSGGQAALVAMVDDGTLDAFAPKSCFLKGMVTASDLREYNGWAKIGCVLLTMEDNLDAINARLDAIVRRLFGGKERGFLPVEVCHCPSDRIRPR